MSTETVEEVVDSMTNPKKFDLIEHLKNGGITLPTKVVSVGTDAESAFELKELKEELANLDVLVGGIAGDQYADQPKADELNERIKDLYKKIYDSRVDFHMKGLAPAFIKVMQKKAEVVASEWAKNQSEKPTDTAKKEYEADWFNRELMSKSTMKVYMAQLDATQDSVTNEEFKQILDLINPGESNSLLEAAYELTFGNALTDAAVDAGFHGRRSDSTSQ